MADQSIWQRLNGLGFNLEQFRSELSDEAQIAEALPENERARWLREQARSEQGEAEQGVEAQSQAGGPAADQTKESEEPALPPKSEE